MLCSEPALDTNWFGDFLPIAKLPEVSVILDHERGKLFFEKVIKQTNHGFVLK